MLHQHALQAGLALQVSSAGTHTVGLPVDPVAVQVLAQRGIDISGHQPRQLAPPIVAADGADLVLTMTRGHLRDVAVTGRAVFGRTLTLREAVRRLPLTAATDDARTRIAAAAAQRRPDDLLRPDDADDIDDPYGRGRNAVTHTADDLWRLTDQLVRLLHTR